MNRYAPKGLRENPYQLVIPAWLAQRVEEEEGCSAQEYVERTSAYSVDVIVVEPL